MSLEALDGRVCVLTGATGGIGKALAVALADRGAKLLLSGRDEAQLDHLRRKLPEAGIVSSLTGDLADREVRIRLADTASACDADTLINLCGQNHVGLFEAQSAHSLEAMLTINLHAPMELTRLMLPSLSRHRQALIVNVGSVFGQIGYPGHAAYCATKFGLRGFSEALRRELQDTDVHIVLVEPRATQTGMNSGTGEQLNIALGNRVDQPELVARRILKSMAAARPRTIIGFPERLYARLNALLPSLIDRSLASRLGTVKEILGTTSSTIS